jgi:hypothetical protein
MAKLGSFAFVAFVEFSIKEKSTADTGSEGEEDKVVVLFANAEFGFAKHGSVSVISDFGWEACGLTDHLSDWSVVPAKVSREAADTASAID